MAVVHHTTLSPTKLELLASWLPTRPWYAGPAAPDGAAGSAGGPHLAMAGGFRLDDPAGEVGMEFMVVTDDSGDRPVTYHVPLAYRGAPLDGADEGDEGAADRGLIGTLEHGVLGRRWVYDGAYDPVLVRQFVALLLGEAAPQAQSTSDTPDPSVVACLTGEAEPFEVASSEVADGPHGTDVRLHTASAEGGGAPPTLRLRRVLLPGAPAAGAGAPGGDTVADEAADGALSHVVAGWHTADGSPARGLFALLHEGSPGRAS